MKQYQDTTRQETKTTLGEIASWVYELIDMHARIAPRFARPEPRRRALAYLQAILSPTPRKNGWQIAEHAREQTPYGMQRLLSDAVWDADLVRDDLLRYVLEFLCDPNAILALDETSFPKRGRKSAGVQRQYCGTTGRVENCQVAVFASYVSPKGHALIDRELYLPQGWIEDPERCREAQIPQTVRFQTKCELARRIVERLLKMGIAIRWVVADTVYGGNLELRLWLQAHGYAYVLAVACDEPVAIQTPDGRQWVEVRQVEALRLRAQDWQRLSMSEGTKGPRLFDWAYVPILHQWQDDGQHWLLIRRCLEDPKEKAYYFVFGPRGTTLQEMVKAIGARWRVEEDFQTTKAMGLDQYEVRSWTGWYRHITLVMLAYAFLTGIRARAQASVPLPLEQTHIDSPLCTCANRKLFTPTSLCALVPIQHPHVLSSQHDQEVQADEKPLICLTVAEVRRLLGRLFFLPSCSGDFVLGWSEWRRHHGWLASFYHTKRRLDAG